MLDNIPLVIISVVLSIATIRFVLKATSIYPREWKGAKWIYDDPDPDTLRPIIHQVIEKLRWAETDERAFQCQCETRFVGNTQESLRYLMALLVCCIREFHAAIQYGRETPTTSSYYVDTMGAVHNKDNLHLMCQLMYALLMGYCQENRRPYPDFILTPKRGNPILGREFASLLDCVSVIAKSHEEPSYAKAIGKGSADVEEARVCVNFEGASELFRRARSTSNGKKLRGVAVDCNASGGKSLRQVMLDFNQAIANLDIQIEPIEDAFVLFRPDGEDDIDAAFAANGLRIHRYCELTEEKKAKMHLLRNSGFTNIQHLNRNSFDEQLRALLAT